jgi:hypothetical protein
MYQTPMSAKQAKLLFIAHVLRHTVGLGVYVWLITVLRQAGEEAWWVMLALGAVYIGFAVFNSVKLWNLYQKRLAVESQQSGGA